MDSAAAPPAIATLSCSVTTLWPTTNKCLSATRYRAREYQTSSIHFGTAQRCVRFRYSDGRLSPFKLEQFVLKKINWVDY
jgi:hypothetical protein